MELQLAHEQNVVGPNSLARLTEEFARSTFLILF